MTLLFLESCLLFWLKLFVAPHERQHYIFIRFWNVPMYSRQPYCLLGFGPCSSQNQFVHMLVCRTWLYATSLTMKIKDEKSVTDKFSKLDLRSCYWIQIHVFGITRCNLLYFRNNWFAAPLMFCINIFLLSFINHPECWHLHVVLLCYGWPLLQAWLLPDLNTIPNNCVRENSL